MRSINRFKELIIYFFYLFVNVLYFEVFIEIVVAESAGVFDEAGKLCAQFSNQAIVRIGVFKKLCAFGRRDCGEGLHLLNWMKIL